MFYTIANIGVLIRSDVHQTQEKLHRHLQAYQTPPFGSVQVNVHIHALPEMVPIPPEAVLFRVSGKQLMYRDRSSYILQVPNQTSIHIDFLNRKIDAWLYSDSTEHLDTFLYCLKWLLIKTAEDFGALYLHGPLVLHNEQCISVIGHSGTGKSTLLDYILSIGGTYVSDDVTLIDAERAYPFFSSMLSDRERWEHTKTCNLPTIHKLSLLLLPYVWNNDFSKMESMSYHDAEEEIWEIYLKETAWNAYPIERKEYLLRAKLLIEDIQIVKLYAGSCRKSTIEICSNLLGL